jgi:hypothetical protein
MAYNTRLHRRLNQKLTFVLLYNLRLCRTRKDRLKTSEEELKPTNKPFSPKQVGVG